MQSLKTDLHSNLGFEDQQTLYDEDEQQYSDNFSSFLDDLCGQYYTNQPTFIQDPKTSSVKSPLSNKNTNHFCKNYGSSQSFFIPRTAVNNNQRVYK